MKWSLLGVFLGPALSHPLIQVAFNQQQYEVEMVQLQTCQKTCL
jgi:hypothetical protein